MTDSTNAAPVARKIVSYRINDGHTREVVAERFAGQHWNTDEERQKVRRILYAMAERRNQKYGAYRYSVDPVFGG